MLPVACLVALAATDPIDDLVPAPIDMGGLRAGYGILPFDGRVVHGPAFGLSYAFQTRHLHIGFQPLEIGWGGGGGEVDHVSALGVRFLRFEGAWIFSPAAPVSAYAGTGIGFSALLVSQDGVDPGGVGGEAPIFAGVELLRQENIRFHVELEGTLPFYRLKDVDDEPAGWPVFVGLRAGVHVKMRRTLPEVTGGWLGV